MVTDFLSSYEIAVPWCANAAPPTSRATPARKDTIRMFMDTSNGPNLPLCQRIRRAHILQLGPGRRRRPCELGRVYRHVQLDVGQLRRGLSGRPGRNPAEWHLDAVDLAIVRVIDLNRHPADGRLAKVR